eukprot:Anaeramoba_ignava/c20638_g4_i3.p1 GENE.c20638_g4_i3~~c20638_g4_i3.p1  ORF type:complete len:190 (+),score=68.06 c20638_g4_i3:465-1034(+)
MNSRLGKLYQLGYTETKESLTEKNLVELILKFLYHHGYDQTLRSLEVESGVFFEHYHRKEDSLKQLLEISLQNTENLWDSKYPFEQKNEEDPEVLFSGASIDWDNEESLENDISVWDEPPDSEENIIVIIDSETKKEEIRAGTLNKLIERLASDTSQDLKFVQIFLITYQSFTTPNKLLNKLIQRFSGT